MPLHVKKKNIRIIPIFLLSLIPSRHIHHAKIKIIMVIFGLTPYHRNPKPHRTDLLWVQKSSVSVQCFHVLRGAQDLSWSHNFRSKWASKTLLVKSLTLNWYFAIIYSPQIQQNTFGLFRHCLYLMFISTTFSYAVLFETM